MADSFVQSSPIIAAENLFSVAEALSTVASGTGRISGHSTSALAWLSTVSEVVVVAVFVFVLPHAVNASNVLNVNNKRLLNDVFVFCYFPILHKRIGMSIIVILFSISL